MAVIVLSFVNFITSERRVLGKDGGGVSQITDRSFSELLLTYGNNSFKLVWYSFIVATATFLFVLVSVRFRFDFE